MLQCLFVTITYLVNSKTVGLLIGRFLQFLRSYAINWLHVIPCSREPSNQTPIGHSFGNTDPFLKIVICLKLISVIQLKVAFFNLFLLKKMILVMIYYYLSLKEVTEDWFILFPIHKFFNISYNNFLLKQLNSYNFF